MCPAISARNNKGRIRTIENTDQSYMNESESLTSAKKKQIRHLKKRVGNRKINVKFNQADIRTILKFFSAELKLNIIPTQEVAGHVTFIFNDINPVDAFDTILSSYGFDWYFENNIVRVFTNQPIKIFRLNYAKASLVAETIQQLVSRRSSVSIDNDTNSLVIKAPITDLMRIKPVIKRLDEAPEQVLVEVKILELEAGTFKGLGNDFSFSKTTGGSYASTEGLSTTTSHANEGLFVKIITQDFESLLKAIKTKTKIDILARPKILAINHKSSNIITGARLGYKVTSATTGGVLTESVQFLEVGTKLHFTPHISKNGDILMEISPEISEGVINSEGIPNETTTETTTSVLVRNGQTILIGGLIRDKTVETNTGIPILSSLPILDILFKRTELETQKKETIILITPYLVTPEMLKNMHTKYNNK